MTVRISREGNTPFTRKPVERSTGPSRCERTLDTRTGPSASAGYDDNVRSPCASKSTICLPSQAFRSVSRVTNMLLLLLLIIIYRFARVVRGSRLAADTFPSEIVVMRWIKIYRAIIRKATRGRGLRDPVDPRGFPRSSGRRVSAVSATRSFVRWGPCVGRGVGGGSLRPAEAAAPVRSH